MESIDREIQVIRNGGILVYPTETLYALGGDALNPESVEAVASLKQRPPGKPFPLLVGRREMIPLVVKSWDPSLEILVRSFWPGPLSMVLPGRDELPPQVLDGEKMVCIRWSSHVLAARLSAESGKPLVATSANLKGDPPAARPWQIDARLREQVDMVVENPPYPGGGDPSTIISIESNRTIRILRPGPIGPAALEKAGFLVVGKKS